ncbi:MAG: sulfatase family protein [Ignavibacteriaceae bacterium]
MSSQDYTRRNFLKTVGVGAAVLALPKSWLFGEKLTGERPNIIFIMSDDHAATTISSYGSRINKTPNIDRLADEGIRFNNCFCTNSLCAPSRAVILTGKYSHINGVMGNDTDIFNGKQQTFPKLLQKEGYQTAMIGKWHLQSTPTGFDYWNVLSGQNEQGDYYNPDFIEMGKKKNYTGYVTDIITDISLNWLKNLDKNKPFCMLFQHKATHANWMPGTKYLTKYDDVDIPEPLTFHDDYKTRSEAARDATMRIARDFYNGWHLKLDPNLDKNKTIREMWINAYNRMNEKQRKAWDAAYGPKNEEFYKANLKDEELVHWKYERFIKDYLRCVDSLDENIGRLLDYLDSSGLAKNTIVVYTSDQGFFLGEHGWWDKRFMYEESLRMPFLVRYPNGIKPGLVNDDIVLNLDFASTFLDYADVRIPADIQGTSLRNIMEENTPRNWRTSMYYHYYEYPGRPDVKKHYGIRTKRYKLIHFYYDIDAWELYDLQEDPHELNNIYDNLKYVDIVKQLKVELKQLQQKYGDTNFK